MSVETVRDMAQPTAPAGSGSRVVRNFASLATGEAVARALAFVAMLLVARRLGPAMYGIVGVASGIMLYFIQIADGGVELSGVPVIARQQEQASRIVSAVLTLRMIAAAALTGLVVAVGVFVLPQPDGTVLALYALGLVFVGAGARWVFLGFQRPGIVAVARIAGELAALVLLFLVLDDAGDLPLVPVAALIGSAVTALLMMAGLRQLGVRATLSFDWTHCRPFLRSAPPLVGFTLLGLVLFNYDLIFLRFVSGEASAGYYAAAYTLIAFAANLIVAWAHSVMPVLASMSDTPAARNKEYASAMALGLTVALPVAVGGILTAPHLLAFVFGGAFTPAVRALQWLLPVIPLAAIREIAVAALITSPRGERHLIRVNAWSAAFNIALVSLVVPAYGLVGAAIATLLTEVLRLVLAARFAHHHGFDGPALARYVRPALAALIMTVGLLLVDPDGLPVRVGLGVVLYALGLLAVGGIRLDATRRPRISV